MKKTEFIKLLEEYLEKTGMSEGQWNAYLSVGDEENVNTTIYIDSENNIWITENEYSIIRIKTSLNVGNIVELRYTNQRKDDFCIICQDNTGLYFCEGEIFYFTDGCYRNFEEASKYFTNNPVF